MGITEIAKIAGVSTATVSRALNHPETVRPQTRQRILDIIEQCGYQPNPHAQALLTGSSKSIALVVPTLRNPYFVQIAEGCEHTASERGFNILVFSTEESSQKEGRVIAELQRRRVDAAVLAGSGLFGPGREKLLNFIKIPIVVIEDVPSQEGKSCVYLDDFAAVRLVCEYLSGLGHRNIGLITGDRGLPTTERKLKYFKQVAPEYGMNLRRASIANGRYHLIESGSEAMDRILQLKERPTAVFAFNDILAIGAIWAIHEKGLRVPDDISVVGMDDIPFARYTSPPLTSIRSPSFEMGSKAVSIAIETVNEPSACARRVVLPVELVIRQSCKALS